MRFLITLLTTAALFCGVASTAAAVEFEILGQTEVTRRRGETVTIDIVMFNASATRVHGLAASVTHYGANGFVGGQAVDSYLNTVCGPGFGCLGGHTNLVGPNLVESAIGANGIRVQIALSAALAASIGTPGTDLGLDGEAGSAQFTVTFVARETAIIRVGTSYQGDGIVVSGGSQIQAAQGANFILNVIPEPGTALLIGLGLAGLASAGRRE